MLQTTEVRELFGRFALDIDMANFNAATREEKNTVYRFEPKEYFFFWIAALLCRDYDL